MSGPETGRDGRKQPGSAREAGRDWTAVRARFVAANITTREFAAAEGIPYSTIAKRAAADGWDAAREAAREKVASGVVRKAVANRIRSESELDGEAHTAAGEAMAKAREMLGECASPQELKAAVEAMEKAYRLARMSGRFTPEPTPGAGGDETEDGEIVIRRRHRLADDTEVEVTLGGGEAHGGRPDRQGADADAVEVSE